MCPIVGREIVEIPTNEYHGEIVKTEITSSQNDDGKIVQYVNCQVDTGVKTVKGWNGLMRFSVPANLTKQTALGRLLNRLNIKWLPGESFDEQSLTGLHVVFDTKRDGNFTNIVVDSIVPDEEE